jgi:Ca-activated chloride channel family protein
MTRLATPWALALLPVAAAGIWWLGRRRMRIDPRLSFPAAAMFGAIPASSWARLEAALPWARGIVLALVVIALARPQAGASLTTVSSEGIDIVIALDISGSMRCEDTRGSNRLIVAKESIDRFVAGRPSDRIGLVNFASAAGTRCPLTLDHEMLTQFVEQIDFAPQGEDRTALGMGLASAVNRLRASKAKSKLVVLVTDGRNNSGQIGPEAAGEAAKTLGVKVDTIGVGSEGPVPCPIDDPRGGRHYVTVQNDLDMDLLQRLASSTGGRAWRAADAKGLEQAFKDIDALEKTTIESRIRVLYSERFAGVLIAAGALLGLELLLAETRLRRLP